MERPLVAVSSSLFILSSVLLFALAGLTGDMVVYPFNNLQELTGGSIDLTALAVSVLLFPLGFVVISIYSLRLKKDDYLALSGPLLSAVLIAYLLDFSVFSFALGLGLIVGAFYIMRTSRKEMEIYKVPVPTRIATKAFKASSRMLAILMAVGVFLSVGAMPGVGEVALDGFLSENFGMALSDLETLGEAASESQRTAAFTMIDGLGLMIASQADTALVDLDPAERVRCADSLSDNMDEMTRGAKDAIDAQLAGDVPESEQADLGMLGINIDPSSIISQLAEGYPLMLAFFYLMIFNTTLSMILGPVAGFYAWLMWKAAPEKHREALEIPTTVEDLKKPKSESKKAK